MELFFLIVLVVVGYGIFKTMFTDKKTKNFRRIWTATRIQNSASFNEKNNAFDDLFQIYNLDFFKPDTLAAEKICEIAKDAAAFDQKYSNNLGVSMFTELGNELLTRSKLGGGESEERVKTGMKMVANLAQSDMI